MLDAILSAAGGVLGNIFGAQEREKDRQAQLDAAQHSVQWRVADAKAAGIHPLAALGMNPISVSPVAVGDTGGSFAQIGQDLGRAVSAGSTARQRADAITSEISQAQLDGLKIDNEIKRAELASRLRRSVSPGTGPVVPEVGPNTARGADIGGQTIPMPAYLGDWFTSRTGTAEEWERQYGDVAQEGYGMTRLAQDAAANYARKLIGQSSWLPAGIAVRQALKQIFGLN